MSLVKKSIRILLRTLWYTFATVTVLTAVGFAVARAYLPEASKYTDDVEKKVVDIIGQPLEISSLDAEWHGITPTLVLKDVEVYSKDKSKVVMRFPKIRIGLDIYESIVNRTVIFTRFDLVGANLFLVRSKDGEVKVTGLKFDSAAKTEPDDSKLREWIFAQDRLSLELSNLVFVDNYQKSKTYRFANVTLMLQNDDDRHLLDAVVKFTEQQNKELIVSIDSKGDLLDLAHWNGALYTSGKSLNINEMLDLEQIAAYPVQFGNSNHEIWIDIKDSRIAKIQAYVDTRDFSVTSKSVPGETPVAANYEKLSGKFLWQQVDSGWKLNAEDFMMKKSSGNWPNSSFAVAYNNIDEPTISVSLDFVNINNLMEIVSVFEKDNNPVLKKISAARPVGVIKDLYVKSSLGEDPQFQGNALLEQFGAVYADDSKGEIVTVAGLDGKLQVSNTVGSLYVKSQNFVLGVPSVFEDKLNLGNVNTDLRWKMSEKAVALRFEQVAVQNLDGNVAGRLAIDWPIDDKPASIDMKVDIISAKGERVYPYLPHKILSSGTNEWLKNAFKKAVISNGSAELNGRLRDFPYHEKQGTFKIKFHAINGVLNYAQQWPLIHGIESDVEFDSTRMLVNIKRAATLSSTLKDVTVEIPDMAAGPPKLIISGDILGETQDKFNYLVSSPPLNKKYGAFLQKATARGQSTLALNIVMDLNDELATEVTGVIDLEDNELDIQGLGNILTNTNGRVTLLKDGLTAKNIKAKLIGGDALINIKTESLVEKGQRDNFIAVQAKSELQVSELSKRYIPVMQDLWSGKSDWDIKVSIPLNKYARNIRGDKGVEVRLESFLQGVEIRLPRPFRKSASEKVQLTSTLTFTENSRLQYRTRYGGYLDSLIEYNNADDIDDFAGRTRGEIRFGSGHAVLPVGEGVRLVGVLDELKLDVWKTLFDQFELKSNSALSGAPPKATTEPQAVTQQTVAQQKSDMWDQSGNDTFIHSADVTVKNFSAWGQRAEDIHLVAKNIDRGLHVKLDSKAVKGVVTVPKDLANNPIKMDFDHITITPTDEEVGGGSADPRNIPSIQASSKSVTYEGRKFGSVEVAITKLTEGIRIEKLSVRPRATTISAYGKWVLVQGKSESEFGFHLDSENLGTTMADLGYHNTIKGGAGKVDVKLLWPGPLTNVNLEQLAGEVHFSLANGQLLDYDPLGKASILGLFSIQTLPRRLFLDFSDLVDKGLSFDSITGDVKIEDGDAYTKNFKMQGPVVGATLAGRIGLAAQDYDQLVTVELRFSDIVSFVGILVASPWAVILPQLLKDEFNSASTLEYTLTGSWSNPKVEPKVRIEPLEDIEVGGD